MAKCHTCGKIADIESKVCRNCGRPNPTRMRRGEVICGVLGVAIVLLVASGKNDHSTPATKNPQQLEPPAVAAEDQASTTARPQPWYRAAEANAITDRSSPGSSGESEARESDGSRHQQDTSPSENAGGEFPYQAHLIDARGKIVIQGGPSIFYKNVETLASGTAVQAAGKSEKWISVRLADGRVGYVRLRQLQFD